MAEKLEPRVLRATPRSLKRLSRVEPGDDVLSIYLDLDPDSFATAGARKSQISSLLAEGAREIEEVGEEKAALREDLEAVRQFLELDDDWPKDAGAVAIFRSGSREMFEIVKLPSPVSGGVWIESTPYVEPIATVISPGDWCVALINRRTARIFLGSPDWLREIDPVRDDVHGQHDQGGWSQARYQRSIENEVANHFQNTSDALMDLSKRTAFRRLVIGVAPELWPEVEAEFHSDLMDAVAGRIEIDVENASRLEVQRELEEIAVIRDNEDEKLLLGRLRGELGTGGRAASGLEEVMERLGESRVETLLVDDAFEATGVACPKCGWLGISGDSCPVDGSELERDVDLVEKVIERTHAQSGQIHFVRYHQDLEALGSIGALLRF
jgi:peptide chain release factor subunit 1